MTVYRSLDEQIADAQKRVAQLKARRTKLENERFVLIGKAFIRAFDDVPTYGSDLDSYMTRVHDAYVATQDDEHNGDGSDSKVDAGIRLDDMLMDE